MMAMCLETTGNLGLIKDYVMGIEDPYDHNNVDHSTGIAENEQDNLGQTLYLVSLFSDRNHPVVAKILGELPRYEAVDRNETYISGRSDFQVVPGYQTRWLKFGLKALGLDDELMLSVITREGNDGRNQD